MCIGREKWFLGLFIPSDPVQYMIKEVELFKLGVALPAARNNYDHASVEKNASGVNHPSSFGCKMKPGSNLGMSEVYHTYRIAFLSLQSLSSCCSSLAGRTNVSDLSLWSYITWSPLVGRNKAYYVSGSSKIEILMIFIESCDNSSGCG